MKQAQSKATRRICVVTGTRAEYGLLTWVMRAIQESAEFELQTLVTGSHLSPAFGNTWRMIEADGFPISAKADMLVSSDTPVAVAKSMGLGVVGIAQALETLQPDLLLVLGDRYETFCAAQVAMILRIPIAHLHGGEATEGLIDEAIRHSVTKMSHLHFVSAEPYRRRVIQLGEQPERVFTVGAFGLDHLPGFEHTPRRDLEADLGISLTPPLFLVTYHPVTLSTDSNVRVGELIKAFESFPQASIVITGANADTDASAIKSMLATFASRRLGPTALVETLGQQRYLSVMKLADIVVGNSSSGLLEAPAIGTPSVNVGVRQQGRLSAPSVINCSENAGSIRRALEQALTPEHRSIAARCITPYGRPGAAKRTVEILGMQDFTDIVMKSFHDLPIEGKQLSDG